jgi:branched-chain amino acid transport system substrate-binding protein
VFRFAGDAAQGAAGLGDYARSTLGWRRAAVVGEDTLTGTTSVAGFVAEFCGLGGVVTTRLWAPPGEQDFAAYVAELPIDVDGYLVGLSGPSLVAFVDTFSRLAGKVDPRRFLGTASWIDRETLDALGPDLEGAVVATPTRRGNRLGRPVRAARQAAVPVVETGPSRSSPRTSRGHGARRGARETGGDRAVPSTRSRASS